MGEGITFQTKIEKSNNPLILKKGIFANNQILNKDEFIALIKPQLELKLEKFKTRLNHVKKAIIKGQWIEAYKRWENFQKDFLFNSTQTSLLVIGNISSEEGKYSYHYNSKEYNILGKGGKLTKIGQLTQQLKEAELSEKISLHLNEMIDDISNNKLEWSIIKEIFELNDENIDVKKNASNARWTTGDWSYKNVIYSNNPHWIGNAADAFMNHMAHLHSQILSSLINNENSKEAFAQSVFNEEKGNILSLLLDSKNNVAWYTGGDIIMIIGGKVYSIQLKTKQQESLGDRVGSKNHIATQDLLKFINSFLDSTNVDEIINLMYSELMTSGWVEQMKTGAEKVTQDFINNNI